ncbi:hypothetical protein FACS1894208_05750 [Clostridia bacterium]|nr:hypothetical protein FACS1894208_05750 [Clostridia bacterium]
MKFKRLLISALFTAVLISLAAITAFASEVKIGELTANQVRFRSEPNTKCTQLGMFTEGTQVLVTDKVTANGEAWYEIVSNYKVGYVYAQYIAIKDDKDFAIGDGITSGNGVNVRSEPNTGSKAITQLTRNTRVTLTGVSQGWYKVTLKSGAAGYIHADYIDVVPAAAAILGEGDGEEPEEDVAAAVAFAGLYAEGLRGEIVAYAKTFLGTPYRYGAMNPAKGFDCSGFTSYVFNRYGYSLNRSAAGQLSNGAAVSKADLLPGDLVLFRDPSITKNAASHAGMYIGGGQFIHASSSRSGGVKISGLSESYYAKYYIGGRRVLP